MKEKMGTKAKDTQAQRSAASIVKKSMPGWRVVEKVEGSDSHETEADAQSVDLDALRKKYLGTDVSDSNADASNAPTQIVVVEPENADAYHRRSGRKAVVVSGDKVIGVQG